MPAAVIASIYVAGTVCQIQYKEFYSRALSSAYQQPCEEGTDWDSNHSCTVLAQLVSHRHLQNG